MDITSGLDKEVYDDAVSRIADGFQSYGGVMAGIVWDKKGKFFRSDNSGACHAWVQRCHPQIGYVLTSLRYYSYATEGRVASRHELSQPEFTSEVNAQWFKELLESKTFECVTKESVVLNGKPSSGRRKEDWLLVKLTPENSNLFLMFMVLTRHPYEQFVSDLSSSGDYRTNTFGAWYHIRYVLKDTSLSFDTMYPFITTSVSRNGNLVLQASCHSHSSLDGIPEVYPFPTKADGKIGYSRQMVNFFDSQKLKTRIEAFLSGGTKPTKEYRGYLSKDFWFGFYGEGYDGRKETMATSSEIDVGPWEKVPEVLPVLAKELWG